MSVSCLPLQARRARVELPPPAGVAPKTLLPVCSPVFGAGAGRGPGVSAFDCQAGVAALCCGHLLHAGCGLAYYRSVRQRHQEGQLHEGLMVVEPRGEQERVVAGCSAAGRVAGTRGALRSCRNGAGQACSDTVPA